jgi:hypothetical protein
MKPGLKTRTAAALLMLLMIQGCDEKNYLITTIVSADGTVDRVIEWRGAPDSTKRSGIPIPSDSSWQMSFTPASSHDSVAVLRLTKHYDAYDALREEYVRINDSLKVRVSAAVERRFRWFYTYYEYSETYADPTPLRLIPASEFFTAPEYQRIAAGDINDTLHARINTWHEKNLSELIFDRLTSAVKQIHDPRLPVSTFDAKKVEITYLLMGDSIYAGTGSNKSGKWDEKELADRAILALRDLFHTDAVEQLHEPFTQAVVEYMSFQTKLSKIEGTYTNTAVLPGLILETNAPDLSGSRVSWKVEGDQISVMDVHMHALSRVANVWAIVVSGVVVLGLILFPAILLKRRALS